MDNLPTSEADGKLDLLQAWSVVCDQAVQIITTGQPALVKQASDRCIIDPAGTSHEQTKGQCFS